MLEGFDHQWNMHGRTVGKRTPPTVELHNGAAAGAPDLCFLYVYYGYLIL